MQNAFYHRLRQQVIEGKIPVIPDIKCISPKHGDLMKGRDPVQMAKQLCQAGAPVLSVVTEPERFGGSIHLLEQVAAQTGLPVLRKDFITTSEQVLQTARAGAAAVLLICAILDQPTLLHLYDTALQAGLSPLVEVHTEQELAMARRLPLQLLGVNNRDITELERDDGTVLSQDQLLQQARGKHLLISESALATLQDVQAAHCAGADAVLVGTAIWQADNPVRTYQALCSNRTCLC